MEYHVNQTNQPHELPKKKWNIVLDNLLEIAKINCLARNSSLFSRK